MDDMGWVKLHRKILNWEWWDDHNTTRLFFTILFLCNFEDKKWRGIEIKRGEFISSYAKLAKTAGLSIRSTRTSISKLKSTSELTIKTTNKYSLFKANNYNEYQQNDKQDVSQATNKRQTNDKQTTTTKKDKNIKNDKNKIFTNVNIETPPQTENPKKENNPVLENGASEACAQNTSNSSAGVDEKKTYGNPEINKMLEALKSKAEIQAFVDSAIERNIAKHCLNLMQKIGKDEFVRRLDYLLSDPFHQKNCNKIKYIYNNIKGFIEPKTTIKTFVL